MISNQITSQKSFKKHNKRSENFKYGTTFTIYQLPGPPVNQGPNKPMGQPVGGAWRFPKSGRNDIKGHTFETGGGNTIINWVGERNPIGPLSGCFIQK